MTIPERVRLHEVIDVVLTTLDARDPYTYEHSFRVARVAGGIAEAMRLPQALRQRLEVAAYLHDIGKIAISDQVLNKAGRLDRLEMLQIQRHPSIGFNILNRLPTFHEIATIVLHHHERIDGNGYPDQLVGDGIPLESRIIAVADAFDAMTSHRPYRRALTPADAFGELRRHAGEQFDPLIVDTLGRLGDQIQSHLENGPIPGNGQHHAYVGHEDLMHSRIVQNAGFVVADERPTRRALPSTLFGRDWTRNLYARYHALQYNANRKGLPFQWTCFADFLTAVAVVAPGDYHPETHRFSFDLQRTDEQGQRLGYCQNTMSIRSVSSRQRRLAHRLAAADASADEEPSARRQG